MNARLSQVLFRAATIVTAVIAVPSMVSAVPIPVISYLFDDNTVPQFGSVTGTLNGPGGTQNSGPTFSAVTPFSYAGNKSILLDGTDDHMRFGFQTVGQAIDGAAAITFTSWIRFETGALGGDKYNNAFFISRVGSANSGASNIAAYVRNDTGNVGKVLIGGRSHSGAGFQEGTHPTALTAGGWHFVVGIFDYQNDQIRLSVDGGLLQTTNVSFNPTYTNDTGNPSSVYDAVGAGANLETFPFKGYIDEVAIFNTALTQDDITFLYQNGLTAIPEPSTFALVGTGMFGVLGLARRRGRRS
jgi:hypothetical protein